MPRLIFLALLNFAPHTGHAQPAISIVYPAAGAVLPPTSGEFLMGSVSDPKALFTVNGQTVSVHSNGAFLAWLPVTSGIFTFECRLSLRDGATLYRHSISIAPPPSPLPEEPLGIDGNSLSPSSDVELRPGDMLLTRMKATPRQKARFRLHKRPWQPMWESNPALGLYEGVWTIPADEELSQGPIEFEISTGKKTKSVKSASTVTVLAGPPAVAMVKGNSPVWMMTAPREGNFFPVLPGTRLLTAGKQGQDTKIVLAGRQSGAIETKHLAFLPPGAHPPKAVTDSITMLTSESATTVRIALSERVPFTVEESLDLRSLAVHIHHAYADTEWMVYRSTDDLVDEIRLSQDYFDRTTVTVRLKNSHLWGYQTRFEKGALVLDLKRPPRVAIAPSSPLKGIKVFLDPGHNPSAPGAVGPLGTLEVDVNFSLAKAVEELLLKEHALPLLSRGEADSEVPLVDRPRLAVEKNADIYVSIHNNNLAPSQNPFRSPHGYSIFYFHPHSLELARSVYRAYEKNIPLPGEELRFGDLLVLRMPEMPSILTESAYMAFPEQEELLRSHRFRQKLAETIVKGLRDFFYALRKAQEKTAWNPPPKPPPVKKQKLFRKGPRR